MPDKKGPTDNLGRKVKESAVRAAIDASEEARPEPGPQGMTPDGDPDWRTGKAKPDKTGTANQRMAALIEDQAAMGHPRPWEVGK